jgi:hypothetical protein
VKHIKLFNQKTLFGVLALSLMILVACQDVKEPEKPANLISKEMMIDILTDCYINNAARSIGYVQLKDSNIKLDSMIYIKYQIDSVQFTKSNEYYSLQFNTYVDILTQVEKRLEIIKQLTDSIVKLEKKNDSIASEPEINGLIESVDSETVQDSIE